MYGVSWSLFQIPNPTIRLVAIATLLTYYLTRLLTYLPAYRSVERFYDHALNMYPEHFRVRYHKAKLYMTSKLPFHTITECALGLRYRPEDCNLNIVMAKAMIELRLPKAWIEPHLKAARENPVAGSEKKIIIALQEIRKDMEDSYKEVNHGVPTN